jgi:hypothetical protein
MKASCLASIATALLVSTTAAAEDVPSPDATPIFGRQQHASACTPGTRQACTCPNGGEGLAHV